MTIGNKDGYIVAFIWHNDYREKNFLAFGTEGSSPVLRLRYHL